MSVKKFPEGFLWGVSTSAHQVEGGTNNQWDRWEKANAHRLKMQAELRFASTVPNWKHVRHQAENLDNYIAANADDFWKLYEQDFDIAQSLGINTFRFSLEWSRIEPRKGEFDASAIKHYQTMVHELKKRGMEPFVTLWHWTVPLWFEDAGGWTNRDAAEQFARFVEYVGRELKGVRFWLTLNEPDVYTANSFLIGTWPPQERNFYHGLKVRRHLLQAHRQAFTILKSINPDFQIGLSEQITYYEGRGLRGKLFQKIGERLDSYFYRKADGCLDFIGLQQYQNVRFGYRRKTKDMLQTDMGWWQNPTALYAVTLRLARYRLPIYVTEHGLPDAHDKWRSDYIRRSLLALRQAIDEGADVRGYIHWSLLDNFEWAHGFWPRFGLVAVDRKSLKRSVRASAQAYAEIVRENGVEEEG
jgi:beta-glucosidase